MTALVATVAAGVVVALIAGLLAYRNSLSLARRNDQLGRTNAQLRELYGPLLALLSATHLIYDQFRGKEFLLSHGWNLLSEPERDAWRFWMSTVFMPLNRRMSEIIIAKSDLVEDDHMPPVLLALCAHVAWYEAMIARWAAGETARVLPRILFPDAIEEHVDRRFQLLKARQQKLLATGGAEASLPSEPQTLDEFKAQYPDYFRDLEGDSRLLVEQSPPAPPESTSNATLPD